VNRCAIPVVLAVVAACSHPPPPVAPSPSVSDEIALAEKAERARRHDIAREHYEKAIAGATDPQSTYLARAKFGETLATWGEYAEAIAQLEQAVAAVPTDAEAWHNLGILREHEGNAAGAIAALERARDLAPQDLRPRIALAAARWKHGDLPGATAEYRELLRLDLPELLRGKVQWALEQLAKATPK
jgi:Tfp pilus assembly protein PilF